MTLKVIGAGFGRTGTLSLRTALEKLGFGPCYHMYVVREDLTMVDGWLEALEGNPNWEKFIMGFTQQQIFLDLYFTKN